MKIFGFEITREQEESKTPPLSFVEPTNDQGAISVGNALGGFYGTMLDMEGTAKTESELVTKYRGMSMQPEIALAVDEIVNEAISVDTDDKVVEVVLEDTDLPEKVQDKIREEFEEVLGLLDFRNQAYDIFAKFYIDGRLNYHIMIDNNDLKRGIAELRYVDPRKIKLIREMDKKDKDPHSGIPIKKVKAEYYMYSENGFASSGGIAGTGTGTTGYRISKDSVVRITSGQMNENNSLVLSHIHPAIKPLNQLRMLEDATVIYTLTRAPERRIFYIDVGNLPKSKAEQYLRDMMTRHKNKLQYNATTGEISDARKMMTMTEDFWFPRRGGERSTEVDVMAGGQSAALTDDTNMQYFQRKLYKSLKVPLTRLEPETMYTFGRSTETTRDEVKFAKFISRMRARFAGLFIGLLEKQLVLKGIMTPEEFAQIKNKMRFDFVKDNYFEELKQTELLRERMTTLRDVEEHVGVYYSREWIISNILQMTEDEAEKMKEQIEAEKAENPDPDQEQQDM